MGNVRKNVSYGLRLDGQLVCQSVHKAKVMEFWLKFRRRYRKQCEWVKKQPDSKTWQPLSAQEG